MWIHSILRGRETRPMHRSQAPSTSCKESVDRLQNLWILMLKPHGSLILCTTRNSRRKKGGCYPQISSWQSLATLKFSWTRMKGKLGPNTILSMLIDISLFLCFQQFIICAWFSVLFPFFMITKLMLEVVPLFTLLLE